MHSSHQQWVKDVFEGIVMKAGDQSVDGMRDATGARTLELEVGGRFRRDSGGVIAPLPEIIFSKRHSHVTSWKPWSPRLPSHWPAHLTPTPSAALAQPRPLFLSSRMPRPATVHYFPHCLEFSSLSSFRGELLLILLGLTFSQGLSVAPVSNGPSFLGYSILLIH